MRKTAAVLCALALFAIGCGESTPSGDGGRGGDAGTGGMAGSGGQGGTTCFQDDECNSSLICCHVGSPFTRGTCETPAVCNELQGAVTATHRVEGVVAEAVGFSSVRLRSFVIAA
jgi:hypothetical protein